MLAMPITEMSARNLVVMKTSLETDRVPVNAFIASIDAASASSDECPARNRLKLAAKGARWIGSGGQPNTGDCTMYRYAIDAQIGVETAPALE